MFTTNVLLLTYRLLITKALCLVDSAVLKIQNCYSLKALVVVVQSLSCVQLFVTTALQASLSFTISWSLLKLMSIESVMPSNHLILYHPLSLPPSVFPSIKKQPYSDKKKKIKTIEFREKKTHSQILNKFILAHFSSSFKNNFQRYQKGKIIQLAFVVSPPSAMSRIGLRWLTRGGVGEYEVKTACVHRLHAELSESCQNLSPF